MSKSNEYQIVLVNGDHSVRHVLVDGDDAETMREAFQALKEYKALIRSRREPGRLEWTKQQLEGMGYVVDNEQDRTMLMFTHNHSTVRFWPYTGWFSGKSVTDGRGFENLVNQLT